MGNAKLRDRAGLHCRPVCDGSYWVGNSRSGNSAGNHLGLSRVLSAAR